MANRNKSPLKILEKMERGRIQRLSNFLGVPLLSRERAKLLTSNLAGTFTWTIRIKAYWKRERGRIRGVPKFFGYPLLSQDFKFCRNIHRVDPNKSPWKMLGIVAVGVVRGTRKFSGHPRMRHIARSAFTWSSSLTLHIEIYTASRGFPATARLLLYYAM